MKRPPKFLPKTSKQKVTTGVILGFVLGSLWLIALRFVTYTNPSIHYHANFAVFINGQRDALDNFTFYEEVQSCGSDEVNNPRTRVHLHGQVNHVVHVHDPAATWGHLFANLGYTLGDNLFKNDDGVFVDGTDQGKLTLWLNGKPVDGVANRTIHSEDTLLISFGNESDDVLKQRYDDIPKDAAEYNVRNDPSSCAGSQEATFLERLKIAIGLD